MQALLSFDQAPPLSAPLRFFLTAPLFAMLAGALIVYTGPEVLTSRWAPSTLALTHLITVGFMLQVMLGALLQLLPVMVGANMRQPLATARLVHIALTLGTFSLVAAFMTNEPLLFSTAVAFLAGGVLCFIWPAGHALGRIATSNPTVRGLKMAFVGLAVTVLSGSVLAFALGWSIPLPLFELTNLHLRWGFIAWTCILLAAVSLVVVPMFQLTPEYPGWFAQNFAFALLSILSMWTLAALLGWMTLELLLGTAILAFAATFSGLTLQLLRSSKRPKHDASHHLWRLSMSSALLACALVFVCIFIPSLTTLPETPLLLGVLLASCFMSAAVGMLYKIVPFLVWSHLQNRGRVLAPNMKKILPQSRIDHQMLAHFMACALLVLSVFWPDWFVRPAGLTLLVANAWLLRNLVYATAVYRKHLSELEVDRGKPVDS